MSESEIKLGLALLTGLVIGWWLRGARVEHSDASSAPKLPPQAAAADAELQQLLRSNQKLAAIKRYRRLTGCGLRDAREAIEQLAVPRR